jgi:rhamnogalacturonyl hydrolase YesR
MIRLNVWNITMGGYGDNSAFDFQSTPTVSSWYRSSMIQATSARRYGHLPVLLVLLAAALSGQGCRTTSSQKYFSEWPAGASPREVGTRVAENFVVRQFEFESGRPNRPYVIYPEVCAWYGSLTLAQLTGNGDLTNRLIRKFDPFFTTWSNRISPDAHVDFRVFGTVPDEIFLQSRDPRYLAIGQGLADKQWNRTTPDGITAEARYWIDDMYMITAVQVQTFRATGDKKYLDHAANAMAAYLDKLQQTNGLFFHAADSPFYWSRGNGWMAAGLTELLRSLPPSHPRHDGILRGYRTMMASLLKYQGEDGLWRQLIDHPEAWPETSGTGMFTFAMVTGVKNGWLEASTYGPAARKAWLGLVKYLGPDANISNVCEGTNKAQAEVGADRDAQLRYYLARRRNTGDLHGQAPLLWTASALLR